MTLFGTRSGHCRCYSLDAPRGRGVRVQSNKEEVMRQIVEKFRSFVQSGGGKPPVELRFRVQAPTGEAAPDLASIVVPHRNAMQSEIIDYLRSVALETRRLTRCTISA